MKYIRILFFMLFFVPFAGYAATGEFMVAAQLLAAAKNADIQQVQILINNGADVNYVDNTGLSLVCTALMNNDLRAAQILQMYGADASKCDSQIKKYNTRNKPKNTGGLFSGLSSAHSLTLAAAGAAVVVGGLFLLTDVFDPGNNNNDSSSGGTRPGGDGGGDNTGTSKPGVSLPYGPAMPTATDETRNYATNLDVFSPTTQDSIAYKNFYAMNQLGANEQNKGGQNYLLMMHGYSPLARGYAGMRTLRLESNKSPVPATELGGINVRGLTVGGGRPTGVALVTTNGVNAASKPKGEISAEKNSLDDLLLAWTTISGDVVNKNPEISNLSSKYYNNKIVLGTGEDAELTDSYTTEDSVLIGDFDLSGYGTAINNANASAMDDLLAKIVGGNSSGYANGDYIGFMPNGQMSIFRTGGGRGFVSKTDAARNGTYTMSGTELATNDTIVLWGKTLTVTRTGNLISATDGTDTFHGYIGADGFLYMASSVGGEIDSAYEIENGNLVFSKELTNIDYKNYKALLNAFKLVQAGDVTGGRSRPDVLANSSVIAPLRGRDADTIADILSVDKTKYKDAFYNMVNKYYDRNETDGNNNTNDLPGGDAITFFGSASYPSFPLVIFSTGSFETDSNWSGKTLEATFENAAPLVFENLEHLFMSVVAVGMSGNGTSGNSSVSGYSPSGKFALSQWVDNGGTTDVTTDDKYYKSRVCGIGGTGAGGIDPWCFAAAGLTDELAVASAAGAAGAVKSAFGLTNKQVFTLLALTADGPYLGSNNDGTALTKEALTEYLKGMYVLPTEYTYLWESGSKDYLDVFKEVFGYGLINLERATKPGSKIYYYDATNNKIVSASGNAYWRSATATTFRASSAFSPRIASISAPFFDMLESIDGELRMPRVWKNEFAIGVPDKRGLYMGDVLGELKTSNVSDSRIQFGNLGLSMAMSSRAYSDNLNGLDRLKMDYRVGNWGISAGFQRYFTDGQSRFSGRANPIMGLASNVVTTDAIYDAGRWSFGARAFSGAITDETLLESDPTVSAQYMPARLGLISGAESNTTWNNETFGFGVSFGAARESDTVLGAHTGGLLNLGAGETVYIDTLFRYSPRTDLQFSARSTFARTSSDASGEFILGMTDVYSDAFSVAVDAGNFNFTIARPLGVMRGKMHYSHADYDIVETDDGNYDLNISNTYAATTTLVPENRELRFVGEYRRSLGQFTDGALGFIYRLNPNNMNDFGNESIFMMKIHHRLGI